MDKVTWSLGIYVRPTFMGWADVNSSRTYFMIDCKADSIIDSMTNKHHQVILSN
jgi:hypothetical protein